MKVFAYLRVSTKEQLDGGGFDRQQNSINGFCDSRGWRITRSFEDQQSGGTEFDGRTGLREILALAGENTAIGVDTIVVENATRIARDLIVQEMFLAECRKRGIKVYCADTGEEVVMANADPSRVMMRQIFGAVAQWEKSMLVLKLQAGRRRKKQQTGEPCGGPKPYGQTASERAVIADIWKLRRAGKSFRQIAKLMNEIRYPAPGGAGEYWHPSAVLAILRREDTRRAAENAATQDLDQ